MLTLYIHPECDRCRHLQERLNGEPLAHDVRTCDDQHPPHRVEDNGQEITGHEEISRHIDETLDLLMRWRRYQSDVCHEYGDFAAPSYRDRP